MNASPTGSDAQALIARLDWTQTPLGPAGTWPQSLRTAVDIVIHSPMPMLLLWGPQLTQIYNDGFALLAGSKHPHAFGQPTHQIWPELQDFTDPIYSAVLQGQVRTYSEQRFTLQRDGGDSDAESPTRTPRPCRGAGVPRVADERSVVRPRSAGATRELATSRGLISTHYARLEDAVARLSRAPGLAS